ncbi:MAG: hypothetical protein K2M60_04270 [Lachnospiraceae bacterium]|nr:hypothetical protein [Lachnospiraceae bacterium]MDE6254096.1 hypothetical protein [Lachnospiraceae bacterium]
MNPSYFRIKLDIDKAIERLCVWNESDYNERIETKFSKAVDVSLDENGQWKGSCLYVYENDGWTIFEDLSGGYSFIEAEQWKDFAKGNEFVFAGYNDAILYAELIAIENGIVTKNFIEDYDMPEDNVNEGDGIADINDWTDVAGFVDDDELVYSDEGIVIIF